MEHEIKIYDLCPEVLGGRDLRCFGIPRFGEW